MTTQIVEGLELFSEAQLENLEFLPEELENIEFELYPSLESISPEQVAKDLEAYFEGDIEEVGLEALRTRGQGHMPNTPIFNNTTFNDARQAIRALRYPGLWGGAGRILINGTVRIDRQGNTGNAQNIQIQTNGNNSRTIATVLVPNQYQNQGNNAQARARQAELLRQVKSALERSLYSWRAGRPSIWRINGNFSN